MDADFTVFWHRAKHFAEFSMKLAGLFTQYNIPGDKYLLLKRSLIFKMFRRL